MPALAHGRIVLWQGASLWILDVPALPTSPKRTDFHAHHAIQVTLALDGQFQLYAADRSLPGPAVVVAPDARHAFEPKGRIALLFVEPESPAGRALVDLLADDAAAALTSDRLGDLPARIAQAFAQPSPDDAALRELGRSLVRRLADGADAPPPDPRVKAVIAWAADRLDRPIRVAEAAVLVGLSADRMSHLFVEQTGLAFRTYLLWLRLVRAVEVFAAGASLTEAAHEAGFADSAHFSRTFRRMFGIAATWLELA